jgi:hypothetical protein
VINDRQENLNVAFGSEAAKYGLLERMAAICRKAELNQACFSVLFCSEFVKDYQMPAREQGLADHISI